MARICGRLIRPSSLSERRILKSLGVDFIRVSRRSNPFHIARKLRSVANGTAAFGDLKTMLAKSPPKREKTAAPAIPALPDSTSEPREAVAA